MAGNTAQGAGQLYDWGDGHGRVHSRPKKNRGASAPAAPVRGFGAAVGYGRPGLYKGDPAPAPALQPQAIPEDPAFLAQQLVNSRNLTVGNAQAQFQNVNTTYDTGYNAQGQRDYSNPYNQAALLDESYKRSKLGTTNSYAASGQLHNGSAIRARNEDARNYSIGSNELQTSAARAYQSTGLQQAQNIANYGTDNDQGALDAILKALGYK